MAGTVMMGEMPGQHWRDARAAWERCQGSMGEMPGQHRRDARAAWQIEFPGLSD